MTKVFGTVSRDDEATLALTAKEELHKKRYVNQQGLNRKVRVDSLYRGLSLS